MPSITLLETHADKHIESKLIADSLKVHARLGYEVNESCHSTRGPIIQLLKQIYMYTYTQITVLFSFFYIFTI